MENKQTIIVIIMLSILIVALIAVSFLYSKFNKTQLDTLTEESNKLIQQDLINEEINEEIRTQKEYAIVEKTIKEYLTNIKNIYLEVEKLNSQINAEEIFSASNAEDGKFNNVDSLVDEYKEKSKEYLEQCISLIEEDSIMEAINNAELTAKKDYYVDLYKTVMLSDSMKNQLLKMEESVEKSRDNLIDKLTIVSNIKKFLEENSRYWNVKDDQLIFTNTNIMVQYYELLNELNS